MPHVEKEQSEIDLPIALMSDQNINFIKNSFGPSKIEKPSPPSTTSSSFISIVTSATTFSSEEKFEAAPVLTTYEIFYQWVLKTVDRAALINYKDSDFLYDTAYVEVMKAVENAMELTVVDVKQDLRRLLECAMTNFTIIIEEKAAAVARRNWERRMRKKLKKSLRRQDNFTGYESPPSVVRSEVSSHESYKIPLGRPCECNPQICYNRYPKDRFGVYLPRREQFCDENITVTPEIEIEEELSDTKENVTSNKIINPTK